MRSQNKVTINIEYRTIVRVVVIGVLSIIGLSLLTKIGHTLALIFISFFLAVALNPVVSWISRHLKSKSRVRATGAAYVMVLLVIAGFLGLVVPTVVNQTSTFIKSLPATYAEYTNEDSAVNRFIKDYDLEDDISRATEDFKNKFQDVGDSALSTASAITSFLLSLLIVLAMTFFMLVEGPDWLKYIWSLQDPEDVPHRRKTLYKMYGVVTGYVNGQLLVALIAGTISLFALLAGNAIFGGDINAVVYALIVTITALIPMFGATIGSAIVVILCSFTSLPLAIAMAIFFMIYQQLENVTIQPLIQSWQSQLTPLIVFIAALIGIGFGGILGAFVAIPIAGCIKVLAVEHFSHKLKAHAEKPKT